MVSKRRIRDISINASKVASRGESISIAIAVSDGKQPISAVIPVNVDITDPEGRTAQFSGSYAAAGGQQTIRDPMVLADKPLGQWDQFRIRQISARTWVWLN